MMKFYRYFKFLKRADFNPKSTSILISKEADFFIKDSSQIKITGRIIKLGGSHPNAIDLPSYNKTILVMEEGSSLEIKGNLFIASGTTIIIRKNAKMIFHGNNYIGHNNLLIAHDHFEMGENTSTSWNVTLMEDDGHDLYYATGKIFPKRRSPLILSKNVGIQMNVTIPRGISVGENALIGAGTILRSNVEANHLIYSNPIQKLKPNISAGLQFQS